uniref:Clr5 domain-containing protein n=1 Tax=Bionectria ochroleuca TaxID=29856 RepID=A0A8H7MZ23_BIOOC
MSASKIPPSEWEKHRQVIHSLYVDKNLPLDALVEEMKTVHGFIATKSQYIRKLASWKIGKNATTIAWKKAAVIIKKRKDQGKESEICIDGKLIPSKKMKKEIARHWPSYLECIEMEAHEIDLPGDFVVQTPPTTTFHPLQPHRWKVQLHGIPWMKFRDAFMSRSTLFAGLRLDNAPMDPLTNSIVPTRKLARIVTASQMVRHYDRILPISLSDGFPTTDNSLGNGSWTSLILYYVYLTSNNLLKESSIAYTLEWIDDKKNAQVIKALLQLKGPTIESCASALFSGAVRDGLASTVQFFLLNGYDPNTRTHPHYLEFGSTGLEIAIRRGINSVTKLLLGHGADPSHESLLARHIDCAWSRDFDEGIIQLLLDAGANVDGESTGSVIVGDDGEDVHSINDHDCPKAVPLVKAVYRKNTQVARLLLEAGANANQVDTQWGSAIQLAVDNNDMYMVNLLVEAGADVNLNKERSSHAWSTSQALSYSTQTRRFKVRAKFLSPLQLAAQANNSEMIQGLLGFKSTLGEYETPLSYAVLGDNLQTATLLLESGANPDGVSLYGHTALGAACTKENLDMVKLLLAYGATPMGSELGSTPLQLAILHKDLIFVDSLLQKGADVNAPPYFEGGRTALQAAAETGNVPLFKRLVKMGADINLPAATENGMSCLQAAMLSGNDEIIDMILQYGGAATVDSILCAVKIRSFKMVDFLMGVGADVIAPGIADLGPDLGRRLVTPLVLAIYNADFDMVDKLLQSGANVSHIYCETASILPLHQAIRSRDLRITNLLLSHTSYAYWEALESIIRELIHHNANVNLMTKGTYPIENVIGSYELTNIFIEVGADVHAPGGSLLARAICGGSSATKLLLDKDVNVNAHDEECGTPLQAAITIGDFELVSELLARGADVNADPNRLVAYAVELEQSRIVELLLEQGANTQGISPSKYDWCYHRRKRSNLYVGGRTVLVAAAEQNNFDLVKALIARGANVEADNALQAASIHDNLPMVLMLLEHGADVNSKPRGPISRHFGEFKFLRDWRFGRRTALQAVSENRNLQLAQLLIERGAEVNREPYEDGGVTALQIAAINGDIQMAVLLFEHGADINGPGASRNGRTALEGAAEHGRLDMIYFLLQNDHDETGLEARCQRAAKYAEDEGHSEIAKVLREWRQQRSGNWPNAN